MSISAALDLGSTRIKAAIFSNDSQLVWFQAKPAPPLTRDGLLCEGNPLAYYSVATHLLKQAYEQIQQEIPIGLASQRSSFLLWERKTGRPVIPLISWQDRRAQAWCSGRLGLGKEISERTGLRLSSHYVGPKLADLFANHDDIKRRAWSNELRFGTLETWLIWKWTDGRVHETDLSMAARTLLMDLESGSWGDDLLTIFGVPPSLLPTISSTSGKRIPLKFGQVITTTIADQAACGVIIFNQSQKNILINLGTGGFVLYPGGPSCERKLGYLTAPLMKLKNHQTLYTLEGTTNGIAYALSLVPADPMPLTEFDPNPNCFCSPETSGLGSPYWRPDFPFLLSERAKSLRLPEQRRVVLEGIIFRVTQIVLDFFDANSSSAIYLAGGLSLDPFIRQGLATCLNRSIHTLEQQELTLLGTARLAADAALPAFSIPRSAPKLPSLAGRYLRSKYERWKGWLDIMIDQRHSFIDD